MTNKDLIKKIIDEKGYVTGTIIKEKGIDTWYLSDMVKKGILKRIGRGIYLGTKGVYDEYFVFQYQNEKAIFSYSNALYFHNLTDQIPHRLEVTVYQGYNAYRFNKNIRVHYVKKDFHNMGVIEIESPYGNPIKVYDKERTLCDLVISKKVIESDVFKQAFQEYFKQSNKDLNKLMKYARIMGIETEMFTLIEVLA